MGFQSNQSRHMYVAKNLVSTGNVAQEGDIKLVITPDKKEFFFQYYGKGGIIRTDLVQVKNITNITATSHTKLRRALLGKKATLATAMLNSGNLKYDGDYLLNLTVFGAYGTGTENKLFTTAAVHANSGSSASDFYKKIACSLHGNIANVEGMALNVFVTTANGEVAITSSDYSTYSSTTATGIIIRQAVPEWKVDTLPMVFADFSLSCNDVNGELWMANVTDANGDVTATTTANSNWVGNGRVTAELEHFTMKQRGDVHGNVGYPYVIDTEYFVDPTQEYDYLNIHYYLTEGGTNDDWSEKDMQIVSCDNGVIQSIVSALTDNSDGILDSVTGSNDDGFHETEEGE